MKICIINNNTVVIAIALFFTIFRQRAQHRIGPSLGVLAMNYKGISSSKSSATFDGAPQGSANSILYGFAIWVGGSPAAPPLLLRSLFAFLFVRCARRDRGGWCFIVGIPFGCFLSSNCSAALLGNHVFEETRWRSGRCCVCSFLTIKRHAFPFV